MRCSKCEEAISDSYTTCPWCETVLKAGQVRIFLLVTISIGGGLIGLGIGHILHHDMGGIAGLLVGHIIGVYVSVFQSEEYKRHRYKALTLTNASM